MGRSFGLECEREGAIQVRKVGEHRLPKRPFRLGRGRGTINVPSRWVVAKTHYKTAAGG